MLTAFNCITYKHTFYNLWLTFELLFLVPFRVACGIAGERDIRGSLGGCSGAAGTRAVTVLVFRMEDYQTLIGI